MDTLPVLILVLLFIVICGVYLMILTMRPNEKRKRK